MKRRLLMIALFTLAPVAAQAVGIFNTESQPGTNDVQRAQQSPQIVPPGYSRVPAQQQPAVPAYRPTTPPAASVVPTSNADPKVMAQFERYANEGDEAYISRMKGVYQRSVAEMERVSRENQEKMRALMPPK